MSTSNTLSVKELCIVELYKIGAIKFGDFILKSGMKSPIYFDLRTIISHPKIMEMVADLIWSSIAEERFDHICGVPYTALPVATVLSLKQGIPMLIRRKEAKSYGTKKLIEGAFLAGQTCLVIEDVIVSGASVVETVEILRAEGLHIKKVVVFLDREQGGEDNLKRANLNFVSIIKFHELLNVLKKQGLLEEKTVQDVFNYLESSPVDAQLPAINKNGMSSQRLSLKERGAITNNLLSRRLFNLIETKKSNLCVAVDVETSQELLSLADKLGPFICLLKTHIDLLKDFSLDTVKSLKQLAAKHDFLICEDRKFADIGNTVRTQYGGGIYHICDWAHLVTVHALPGPGIIEGLISNLGKKEQQQRGCILVAEMSSDQNLIDKHYVQGCIHVAESYPQFVAGFVCQSRIESAQEFVRLTPGVSIASSEDKLGQRYVTPEVAVLEKGSDVIIVGRGITADPNPTAKAAEYQQRAYSALIQRSQTH